ncbi:MAG: PAS domain-containing sensor histidine kinase [Thiotrichales bacterium]|jgi:two-component system sensor histidine kinase FlrB|nr:PAS domain-containing sensor histidine kinase [Thiotrichales bacterium]
MSAAEVENQRLRELEEAFALFNTTSEQLATAYDALQLHVIELTQELAQARSERLLQLAEKERVADRLARLLTLLPAAVLVLDQMGKITEVNATAIQWLNNALVGQSWQSLLPKFATAGEVAGDWVLPDNRILNVSETVLDKALGKIVLLMDVTEQRSLSRQLSQHQRLRSMGEMAASLAHQIRTPLAAALLYASQLSLPQLTDDKRQHMNEKILARLRHLENLVTDMLQYAKGGQSGNSCIAVSDLLQQVQQVVEEPVHASNSRLFVETSIPDAQLRGDLAALITAVQSLVINAIDVVKEGAEIRISASLEQQWIKLCVQDKGPGVPLALQEKIFEPFYTSRAQGTGLGLAVTRAVAQAHHGHVSLHSVEGQGSEFCIWLPKQEESL